MNLLTLQGSPDEIGFAHGTTSKALISDNIKSLVAPRSSSPAEADSLRKYNDWIVQQERLLDRYFPELLEEIAAIARGCGESYEHCLKLNLRVWLYHLYTDIPGNACSSVAMKLANGTLALAGALDDTAQYYPGAMKIIPQKGFRFITWPIGGTVWGNRGMNSAGLSIGESSQILPGLKPPSNYLCADLALRIILQYCSTVAEVEEVCRRFSFNLNLIATDKSGGVFAAHRTVSELFVASRQAPCVLTNHISDDELIYRLSTAGVTHFPESPTTRSRRGRLLT